MSAQSILSTQTVPSTSHNHNDRRTPSPPSTSIQTGGSSSHPSVLGYTVHPNRVYDAKKNWREESKYKYTQIPRVS